MDNRFIQVRLTRDTEARLRRFARHSQRLVERGRLVAPIHHSHGLTLETAVSLLLDRWEGHMRRNARRTRQGQGG